MNTPAEIDLSDYGVDSLTQPVLVRGVDSGTIMGINAIITHIFIERQRRAGAFDFSMMLMNNQGGNNEC